NATRTLVISIKDFYGTGIRRSRKVTRVTPKSHLVVNCGRVARLALALGALAGLEALSADAVQNPPIITFTAEQCDREGWIRGASECLHIETARSDRLTPQPSLVVVLHGDSPFSRPRYQYDMAHMIARENASVVAVGVLRPGYTDPSGNRSSGVR